MQEEKVPEITVIVRLNEMGEHHAEVVDFENGDLRDLNMALDWIDEVPRYELVRVEKSEYFAMVYIEAPEPLRWVEKDELIFDAEGEIIRWMRSVEKVPSLRLGS